MRKRLIAVGTALLCVLLFGLMLSAPLALAGEGREGQRVVIGPSEVVDDDLYVAAETFILDGRVKGDLFVAAKTITINGVVEGDLFAGGQSIIVNGTLQDDARLGGYLIELGPGARVLDDLQVMGYSLETAGDSAVGGSLFVGGYQAILAGAVEEDAWFGGYGLELRGTIGGDLEARVGPRGGWTRWWDPAMYNPELPRVSSVPGGLTLAEGARIGGDLKYTAPDRVQTAGVVVGETVFTYVEPEEGWEVDLTPGGILAALFAGWLVGTLRQLAAMLIVAALVALLASRWLTKPAEAFKAKPWESLGWGALAYFLFPVAMLVLVGLVATVAVVLFLVTLGNLGLPVALVGAAVILLIVVIYALITGYLTKVIAGYVVGRLMFPNDEWARKPILPTLIGTFLVVILTSIPLIGWLLSWIITLFGLGALWLAAKKQAGRAGRTPAAVPGESAGA